MNKSQVRRRQADKLYVALAADGKHVGHVQAYNAKEAADEFRRKGVKFARLVRS